MNKRLLTGLFALSFALISAQVLAQGNQCRTAPVGTSTQNCASEAFVTGSGAAKVTGPNSSAAGDIPTFSDTTGKVLADSGFSIASALANYLTGLTLSNDVGTPNSVLDIASGVATDSTNAALIKIGAFTKSTAGAWAAGSGSNGMGNGLTIANATWYHVCLANNSGSPDIWFDTQAACSNRPSGISDTKFRRIGSFKTDGSAHILAFSQLVDEFLWKVAVQDLSTSGSVLYTATLSVPTGVKVWALHTLLINNASTSDDVILTSPDENDAAINAFQRAITTQVNGVSVNGGWFTTRTNTSGQVRIRLGQTTTTVIVGTRGWIDPRGKS